MQLITGGMGFIGLHTAKAFLDAGTDVVLSRYRNTRTPSFLEGEIDKHLFVEPLDLTSAHDVIGVARKYPITGIVHLAAPPLGVLSPAEDFRVNMSGLINVLEAARQIRIITRQPSTMAAIRTLLISRSKTISERSFSSLQPMPAMPILKFGSIKTAATYSYGKARQRIICAQAASTTRLCAQAVLYLNTSPVSAVSKSRKGSNPSV